MFLTFLLVLVLILISTKDTCLDVEAYTRDRIQAETTDERDRVGTDDGDIQLGKYRHREHCVQIPRKVGFMFPE